ncbi:hybrid sensor histidine kinase/response regulator [Coleofasciculus sp. LEGE 07081]|uniref:hybrid sensor histidine kinase/response regulator n=1 Tax=Coleofasciculus sp. LEGE 07081 TaxID=2777967 RepID=UPI00187E8A28|nr:hybrid sensor histidine kinase/response regulator [Coleofasciculus sp. LEGE 07081]MBE9127885.1 hybrid sensor histidine kinase/response regulator [Coleofasciculus sp. LEGE 07081]
MTHDQSIREQSYHYFLEEAPELLQVLEQELLNLRVDFNINKVHNLMRTTHTLKGAAASIGLETIKSVAHSLEDIFKSLLNTELVIDADVEALIFESYECLRVPLTAQLTGGQVNEAEILDRTAAVFTQLQEKLGDCFGQDAYIPTSVELGFDVTQSIFEVGVIQRLNELTAALDSEHLPTIANTLRAQAEIFLGLAESLNLPGFGAIAQTALTALDTAPDQAVAIARTALVDFQNGHAAVLAGDRTQGGQVSLTLQELAGFREEGAEEQGSKGAEELGSKGAEELGSKGAEEQGSWGAGELDLLSHPSVSFSQEEPVHNQELINEAELSDLTNSPELESIESSLEEFHNEESDNSLLEAIWGGETFTDFQTSEPVDESSTEEVEPETEEQRDEGLVLSSTGVMDELVTEQPSAPNFQSLISQKDSVAASQTIRVNVEHLEQLNYSVGELLTNQNHQSLQHDQLQSVVRVLLTRLQQHQRLLEQLQDWSDRQSIVREQRQTRRWGMRHGEWAMGNKAPQVQLQSRFDSLELDSYSESHVLIQSLIEDTVQLAEAAEAIDLFTHQSNQTLDKQRRLLTNTRDILMEARMLPLGEIFGRFPRVLQQLEITRNKSVELTLRGTDVLVDKVVAQKLYDPLLHLVRNAFDHGIESPEIRQQHGKPRKGQIEICASYQGKYLVIEVRDDGLGLDFERIRQRAADLLFDPGQASSLSESQLKDLLFEPGFSTASEVNDLSGRGIGLDVVRAQLQALQGSITIESQSYQGTTFRLQIPLNLTIAKLLLVQSDEQVYALLTDAIEQIIIPQSDQLRCWDDGKVLRWGQGAAEQLIPIFQLATVLDYGSPPPKPLVLQSQHPLISQEQPQLIPLVLIRCQDKLLGLEVNQLIGEQELVIRPLGATIASPRYIYGGSILANGRLTLVIDGATLMQHLSNQFQVEDLTMGGFTETESTRSTPIGDTRLLGYQAPQLQAANQPQQQLPTQNRAALPASRDLDIRVRSHPTVLLVDDSVTVRQSLAMTLQHSGYQVLQARDGCEAIEQLQRHPQIQLVICDIEMPRMNGFEFLKHCQHDSVLAYIPVAILSSRSGEKHRLIAEELGAIAYITKPYLEHELLAIVSDALKIKIQNSTVDFRE